MSDLLAGVKVLESAVLLNGDTLGMLLGDLGAEVIKVEAPGTGDYIRDILGQVTPRNSPAHLQVNKNKRSIALNLRSEEGNEVFWDLQAEADIFIDGFAGAAADRLGIGYEQQKARKSDIVYCQYTGFGRNGPYAGIPTHGQMMNAEAAGVPLRRDDDGFVRIVPNQELMWGTTAGGDGPPAGAVHAALHVVSALLRRDRTGEGAFLDASATDAIISQAWMGAIYGLNIDRVTERAGLREPDAEALTSAKYQYYETADSKFILFCCIEAKFWNGFCEAVGRDDLMEEANHTSDVDFGHGEDELRRELQSIIETRSQSDWIDLAIGKRLPIGPAHQGVESLREDPHLAERQIFHDNTHPIAGEFTYVGSPVILDGEDYELHRHAPSVGEHTTEILTEIGYSESRIASLKNEGVVVGQD